VKTSAQLYENLLLKRIKEEDKSAFSILFSAYYADLVMFSTTFTHNKSVAEEIVQDVFVRFWEGRHALKITGSLKSYLLKSVQNGCIDWLRHMKMRHAYEQYFVENSSAFDNDNESYQLCSELQERMQTALEHLPKEVAESFLKNRFEGLGYQDIAKLQGVSERTVEVRIGKALRLLREHLRDYFITI